jgi:DNA-binding response OmpR family regulator/anti-sigma regulatory factor (Ser/Thr protein kinase)
MQNKKTILVVDDDAMNINIISLIIENQYAIETASNGEEALKIAMNNPPDLILLDVVMPFMDGFETCMHLKQAPETRDIPVIFNTSKSEAEDIIKGLKLGAVDYVIKPFNRKELLFRINRIVEMTQNNKELNDLLQTRTEKLQETTNLLHLAKEKSQLKKYVTQFQIVIPSQMKFVNQVIHFLGDCYQSICKTHNLNTYHIEISLIESLTNAIIHGNLEVPSHLKQNNWDKFDDLVKERESIPEYADRKVTLNFRRDDHQIEFEIEDQGQGFDLLIVPDPTTTEGLLLPHGRGLMLIRSFMDQVNWNDKGNCITMVKTLRKS